MRRFWQSLRPALIFVLAYLLSNYLFRWFHHHRGPSLHQLPEDLVRAVTVAAFYFLANYLLQRRSTERRTL